MRSLVVAAAVLLCGGADANVDLGEIARALERLQADRPHAKHRRQVPAHSSAAVPPQESGFGRCAAMFAGGQPPIVPNAKSLHARALCFDGFAVLHSGSTKTPLYSAEVLTRSRVLDAQDEKRTNVFFADARLPSAERATLEDYRASGFDRGHLSPAADMPDANAMAQSFSLANMVPQAPENNRKAWAAIEKATRKYALRAAGRVYVISGPVFEPGACPIADVAPHARKGDAKRCLIGSGVRVPTHLFKLVYDAESGRAWAHWIANTNDARVGRPISYEDLVRRTGITFLPGVQAGS